MNSRNAWNALNVRGVRGGGTPGTAERPDAPKQPSVGCLRRAPGVKGSVPRGRHRARKKGILAAVGSLPVAIPEGRVAPRRPAAPPVQKQRRT